MNDLIGEIFVRSGNNLYVVDDYDAGVVTLEVYEFFDVPNKRYPALYWLITNVKPHEVIKVKHDEFNANWSLLK